MRDSRPLRICYAGTYERRYPRNRLTIAALRAAGARVEEAHVPVFEHRADKSGIGPLALLGLLMRLALAWARLVPGVALRMLRCDVLAIGYIGQLDMLVLAPLARLMRRPVLFNPLVTLTDTLVEDRKLARSGSLPARLIARVDRSALALADVVLADTGENARYLRENFDVPADRIVVLPVGADEAIFVPAESQPPPHACLDVLFYGKFIPLHGIETIVRATGLLTQRGLPIHVELVGRGQTWPAMRDLARTLAIPESTLTWTDWIPAERLGARLGRADVALGIFDNGPKAARVVPNKLYQALACGVATVTRESPAVAGLLRDGDSALLVPPDDPAALALAIERLLDPRLRAHIAEGGLRAYREHASPGALAGIAGEAIDQLRQRRAALARTGGHSRVDRCTGMPRG